MIRCIGGLVGLMENTCIMLRSGVYIPLDMGFFGTLSFDFPHPL